MKINPCKNNVGAIIDTDLKNFTKETIGLIKDSVNEYGVIFLKNQKLAPRDYINFAKQFGQLADYPMLKGLENFPEITVVEKKPGEKNNVWRGMAYRLDLHKKTTHVNYALFCKRLPQKERAILDLLLNT